MSSNNPNRKQSAMHRLLDDPEKQIHMTYGVHGSLAKLWRRMLMDLRINGYRFSVLMDRYLRDPKNHLPNNRQDRTTNRGNYNKEFSFPQMSWKVFCKGMNFLLITKIDLQITAHHADGKVTIHQLEVPLDSMDMDDETEADEDDDIEPAMDQEEIAYLDYKSPIKVVPKDES